MIPLVIDASGNWKHKRWLRVSVGQYDVRVAVPVMSYPLVRACKAIHDCLGISMWAEDDLFRLLHVWSGDTDRLMEFMRTDHRWLQGSNHLRYASVRDFAHAVTQAEFTRFECHRCFKVAGRFIRRYGYIHKPELRNVLRFNRLTHPRCRSIMRRTEVLRRTYKVYRRDGLRNPWWLDWHEYQAVIGWRECRTLLGRARKAIRGEFDEHTAADDGRKKQEAHGATV